MGSKPFRGRLACSPAAGSRLAACLLLCVAAGISSPAQEVELVSRAGFQLDAVGANAAPGTATPDGRYVAFASAAPNVVPGQVDLNDTFDVFLRDRLTGTTTLVSHTSSPVTAGDSSSTVASVSAAGDVVFESYATNLGSGLTDANGALDVFHYSRATGVLTLVSHTSSLTTTGNGASAGAVVSENGAAVAFRSSATNLGAGFTDANGTNDVFGFVVATGVVSLLSHTGASTTTASSGISQAPAISDDGLWVAFLSRGTDLVTGQLDTNGADDVFLADLPPTVNRIVSHTSSLTTTGDARSGAPRLSSDGRFVAFASQATNLGATYTNLNSNGDDVFRYDRTGAGLTLVSHTTVATSTGNGVSANPEISDDGATIAFDSRATNLQGMTSDTNGTTDVALWTGGTLTLVSRTSSSGTTTGNGESRLPRIADGGWVAFETAATNLVSGVTDVNGNMDVYLRGPASFALASRAAASPLQAGNGGSFVRGVSDGGAQAFMESGATDLGFVDASSPDVLAYDAAPATVDLVSRRDPGSPSASPASFSRLDASFRARSVSDSGRYTAFESLAPNVVGSAPDPNLVTDVYLFETATNATTLVSHASGSATTAGNDVSTEAVVSSDGRFVAFTSFATNLVPGVVDVNGSCDVFLWDRATGTTVLVSHALSPTTTATGSSTTPRMDASGRYVAFTSDAADVGQGFNDFNGGYDVFLFDALTGSIALVSHAAALDTTGGDWSLEQVVSGNGQFVAFSSAATDLGSGYVDANGFFYDVFLYEVATGSITLVSHTASPGTTGDSGSYTPDLGDDGSVVAFESFAGDLGSSGYSDLNGTSDVFLFDRATGAVTLVSHTSSLTTAGNDASYFAELADDGSRVAFVSDAGNLGLGITDTNLTTDVYLWTRTGGVIRLVSHTASQTTAGNAFSSSPAISRTGGKVAFASNATDIGGGLTDTNGASDVFLFDRGTGAIELVSHGPSPTGAGNRFSDTPRLALGGTHVAFSSYASDVVPADRNANQDVFLFGGSEVQEPLALLAAKGSGSAVDVTFTPACGAIDHAAFVGSGPISGAAAWGGAACGLGTSGAASFDPGVPAPGGFLYFVIVGEDGIEEGSYGRASSGVERPEAVGLGACDAPRELGGVCP